MLVIVIIYCCSLEGGPAFNVYLLEEGYSFTGYTVIWHRQKQSQHLLQGLVC